MGWKQGGTGRRGRQLAVRFERSVNRTRSFLYEEDDCAVVVVVVDIVTVVLPSSTLYLYEVEDFAVAVSFSS